MSTTQSAIAKLNEANAARQQVRDLIEEAHAFRLKLLNSSVPFHSEANSALVVAADAMTKVWDQLERADDAVYQRLDEATQEVRAAISK